VGEERGERGREWENGHCPKIYSPRTSSWVGNVYRRRTVGLAGIMCCLLRYITLMVRTTYFIRTVDLIKTY